MPAVGVTAGSFASERENEVADVKCLICMKKQKKIQKKLLHSKSVCDKIIHDAFGEPRGYCVYFLASIQ